MVRGFEDVQMEFGEIAEVGDNVVVTYSLYARGRASGAEINQPFTLARTLREGKVIRVRSIRNVPRPSKPPGCRSRRCAVLSIQIEVASGSAASRHDEPAAIWTARIKGTAPVPRPDLDRVAGVGVGEPV